MAAMQRIAILSLALSGSASATSLRGNPSEEIDEQRRTYGLEYGLKGLGSLFDDVETPTKPADESSTPENDSSPLSNIYGPQVMIEASDTPFPLGRDDEIETRIVNGIPAPALRPFAMHLSYNTNSQSWHFAGCGGTLITNCHILTAAHCVAGDRSDLPHGIYVGAWKPFQGNAGEPYHFSLPLSVSIHPDFVLGPNIHDIAIITLQTCANTNTFPVMELADDTFMSNVNNGDSTTVVGFGDLGEGQQSHVEQLRTVDVPFIDKDECDSYYPDRITDDMICAGFEQGGKDACQGDSGGPQFVQEGNGGNTVLTQIGVVSWGTGCARPDLPGVYSNVAVQRQWIADTVCPYPLTDTSIELCTSTQNTEPTTAPPTSTPSLSPSKAPASCSALGGTCANTSECCSGMICMQHDSICIPIPSKNSKQRQHSAQHRRHGTRGKSTTPPIFVP